MEKGQIKKLLKIFLSGVIPGAIFGGIFGLIVAITNIDSTIFLEYLVIIFSNSMYAVTLIGLIILVVFENIKSKIKADNYSDDENSEYSKQEKNLTLTLSISTMMHITNFFLFSIDSFDSDSLDINTFILLTINLTLCVYLEIAHINMLKKIEPTRYADPLSSNYNEETLELADERELQTKGKAALKTSNTMTKVYLIYIIVGIFSSFDFTFLLGIWAIYITQSCIMLYNTLKCSYIKV